MNKIVNFTRADLATEKELKIIDNCFEEHIKCLTKRIIEALLGLRGNQMGYRVDQLEHSLQTATRALRDGSDQETIVCALLHDIGEHLAPVNHGELAAAILRPYVSPENAWIVQYHGIVQSDSYLHQLVLDGNEYKRLQEHPAFEQTIRFCHKWDQISFDPNYDTLPLSVFVPMLENVFSQKVKCLS
ncbi:HD domain-containing protein [Coleofasciculus sp. G2-EDA-02]|uniref:HD domain-containing protein n=1 Tax=Coleofasciculus sp. G2-EDA-02 TaxID=3069529 RepID=UPI0033052BDB